VRIKIKTKVSATLAEVQEGFNKDLFLQLSPPFPKVELQFFEGSTKGDLVSLELNFGLFKQTWTSKIMEDGEKDGRWYFIDEGTELPFFLKSWRHLHVVESRAEGSVIIDDITYTTGTIFTDLVMYLPMLGQFLYRKPIYKRVFRRK